VACGFLLPTAQQELRSSEQNHVFVELEFLTFLMLVMKKKTGTQSW